MKDKKPKENHGEVPKSVIDQLTEHTVGGFVLFYFNSKDGAPEEILTFDSPAHCLALQKHIADWTYALQDLHVETEKHHIQMACRKESEQDDQDEGEGVN
jgi:hypothetical protein